MAGYSSASQRATAAGSCSRARCLGFCGLNRHARRYLPTVVRASHTPYRWAISSATASRVHRNPGRPSWSGVLSRTSAMTSRCWPAESAACSPARRPRRRSAGPAQPPSRERLTQRFTALGCTPNTRAASAWGMPSRTAWTARLRSAAWAAPGRDRASLFGMPQIYHIITLFAYLGNNHRRSQPELDLDRWCQTQPPPHNDPDRVVLLGLPALVQAQLLYGLQQRCRRDTKTRQDTIRSLCVLLRHEQVGSILELPVPTAPHRATRQRQPYSLAAEVRTAVRRACSSAELER